MNCIFCHQKVKLDAKLLFSHKVFCDRCLVSYWVANKNDNLETDNDIWCLEFCLLGGYTLSMDIPLRRTYLLAPDRKATKIATLNDLIWITPNNVLDWTSRIFNMRAFL